MNSKQQFRFFTHRALWRLCLVCIVAPLDTGVVFTRLRVFFGL